MDIKVSTEELRSAGLIRQYTDPILTEDRKIDFESLNLGEQTIRVKWLINKEQELTLEEDKEEFLKNIMYFLNGKPSPGQLLLDIEQAVKKYCSDADSRIRGLAGICQLILTSKNPSIVNIEISLRMFEDSDSSVREVACRNLKFLLDVAYDNSLELAKKIIEDDWRVRSHLWIYLFALAKKSKEDSLEICKRIIERLGRKGSFKENEDILLNNVIFLIIMVALKSDNTKYIEFLNQIVSDVSYSDEVKRLVAFNCKRDEFILDKKLSGILTDIYTKLIENSSPNLFDDAIFFLFYTLTKKRVSFLPEIKPLLDLISNKKLHNTSFLSNGSFQILDYLATFCKAMSEESVIYIARLCRNNHFLIQDKSKSWRVKKILECLSDEDISLESQVELQKILREIKGIPR